MKRATVFAVALGFLAAAGALTALAAGPVRVPVTPAARVAGATAAANFDAAAMMPMVEITKTCPPLRYLGREATFEITVANKGNAPAKNVTVTDAIVGGTQFVSADNGGTRQGDLIVWNLGTLAEGKSVMLKSTVRCVQPGIIRNTARVSYCAEAAAVCETEVKGVPAILLECVDNPDPIEVGSSLTYTITVTNQGTLNGTNIMIECTLPAEQEFVQAGGAANATADGRSIKFAPLPSLAPKASANFTVTVKGIKAADSRFRVSLKSDQIETPVEETESTHIYD